MIALSTAEAKRPVAAPFIVSLRVFSERLLVDDAASDQPRFEEVETPVLALGFDYGGVSVRPSDERSHFIVRRPTGAALVERDREGERRAQCLLESFGAVELSCVEHSVADEQTDADYLVQAHGDVHAFCSFTSHALPQLEALGWRVEIDPAYPYRVVSSDGPWFANVLDAGARDDWFSLQLGIDVGGERVDLLPALLELLKSVGKSRSLKSVLGKATQAHALPAGDGRYVLIEPARLERVLEILLELYGAVPSSLADLDFPAVRAPALARLDRALTGRVLRWRGATALRERGRALLDAGTAPKAPPARGLAAELRPYQTEGVSFLQWLRAHDAGGLLADDMGLGKTLQAIAHLCIELESGRMDRPSLVVAPTSVLCNWQRELARFAPGLRVSLLHGSKRRAGSVANADVLLTSYTLLVRDLEKLRAREFHLLILDEAQAIKNARSLASQAARSLDARHRLCLTGTPLENNLGELWSLFEFAMPGLLGSKSAFGAYFRTPIERDGNAERLKTLRERMAPFVLRRMKEQVAQELPPKTEIARTIELGAEQRELYESIRVAAHADVRRAIRTKGLSRSQVAVLDALMKLRQVCCDPRLVRVSAARNVADSAKYEGFFELLERQLAESRRVLVFSQFARMLALLGAGLDERQIRHVVLTGQTRNRQAAVDAFQAGRAKVFLISLKAGGTGLNLTSADTVIHYDPWWNPAAQMQATDRAHRIGQTRPVFVYGLIAAGSVEERMLRLQQRKRQLANLVLQSGGAPAALSAEEIEDLLAPLPEA